jgi:hypothetical protein
MKVFSWTAFACSGSRSERQSPAVVGRFLVSNAIPDADRHFPLPPHSAVRALDDLTLTSFPSPPTDDRLHLSERLISLALHADFQAEWLAISLLEVTDFVQTDADLIDRVMIVTIDLSPARDVSALELSLSPSPRCSGCLRQ